MMNNIRTILFFCSLMLVIAFRANSQDRPIGYWRSLPPFDTASSLTSDGTMIYCATGEAMYSYDSKNGSEETYTKVEGMADVGSQIIGYDAVTSAVVIIYTDGNIDIFKKGTFYNIPDFYTASVAGSKIINGMFIENGYAYLSTSVGVIVLDLTNNNISENYQFTLKNTTLNIQSFTSDSVNFYACTSSGLYYAPKSSPDLQNFQIWQHLDSTHVFTYSTKVQGTAFFANTASVYTLLNDTIHKIYTLPSSALSIMSIDGGMNNLFVSAFNANAYYGYVNILDKSGNQIDTITNAGKPRQTIQLTDTSIWLADAYYGMGRKYGSSVRYQYSPPGPGDPNSYAIFANNKNVWVAHGGYNQLFQNSGNPNGISNLVDGNWVHYQRYQYVPFSDTVNDFVSIVVDEQDTTMYAGSFNSGLFELHPNGAYKIYKQGSILDPSYQNSDLYQVIGLGLDQSDNLWVSMYTSYHELYCKEKATGNWYAFHTGYNTFVPYTGGPMAFDQAGDVWYVGSFGGGVIGYSTNGTLSNPADDTSYWVQTGVGYGNLPNETVLSIAIDQNDNLWVGTTNGIGIIYNASSCILSHCDATIPIVQYDQFAGYLFAGENVHTIAVDGANRKWVGTDNGVWLLSPDASQIIYKFTVENSPLPSNSIQKISIDKVTGDVYIGTTQGLVSFRGTSTGGGTSDQNVLVFPDPVPSGYSGTIAIKGLTTNADVRITDIKGELMFKTTALGGQAIWNGLDYKGRRPDSGVYLVFVSSPDGSQTYTGKFVFLK